jgi:hypothetical protein
MCNSSTTAGAWSWHTKDSTGVFPSTTIEILNFATLTDKLIKLEKKHDLSSLEVFRRYLRNDFQQQDTVMKQWFGLFFLYLGTPEVRDFHAHSI